MPHITIHGCDMDRQIQIIDVHVFVQMKPELYRSNKCEVKLDELQEKIEKLVGEYFDPTPAGEQHTNHEWNTRMKP